MATVWTILAFYPFEYPCKSDLRSVFIAEMDLQSDDFSFRSTSPSSQVSRNNSKNYNNGNDSICGVGGGGVGSLLTGTTIYHQVEIRPRDSFKFFVRADNPLETLHFSFYTRKKSTGFGLFYLYLPNLNTIDDVVNAKGTLPSLNLPIDKVKELIGASRENVRLQRMGQEGPLARTLSINKSNSRSERTMDELKY